MSIALMIFSLILIIASFISAFDWQHWIIYGLRAQRFQVGVFLVIMLLCFPLYYSGNPLIDWLLLALMVAALIFNIVGVYRFTPLSKVELPSAKDSKNSISFATANVRMKNEDGDYLVEQLKDYKPDVILLTEVSAAWIDRVSDLEKDYAYTCLQPQENTYGMAMYSKYPFEKSEVKFLVEKDIPSIHCHIKFKENQLIQFVGLHPRPPAPGNKEENKDIELYKAAGMTNENGMPSVVSGDLNDVAWSAATSTFKQISGLVDPRVGRGFYNTYNAKIPFFRMPIDHFFVSKSFKLISMKRLKKFGSDHYPIYIELNLEKK